MASIQKTNDPTDLAMMRRCIELSRAAIREGEYPFATVIAVDGKIVAEAINAAVRERDVSRHAEVIALSQAQKMLGRKGSRAATLYTNVEPCAMCSFCLREAQVGRVVLCDRVPGHGRVVEVEHPARRRHDGPAPADFRGGAGGRQRPPQPDAEEVWRDWNPAAWQMIKRLGFMTDPAAPVVRVEPARSWSLWRYLRSLLASGA